MYRKKFTPCRNVGLSKKNTPAFNIENSSRELNENSPTTVEKPLVIDEKPTTSTRKTRKSDQNSFTPCRTVGLSRKRKMTPNTSFNLNGSNNNLSIENSKADEVSEEIIPSTPIKKQKTKSKSPNQEASKLDISEKIDEKEYENVEKHIKKQNTKKTPKKSLKVATVEPQPSSSIHKEASKLNEQVEDIKRENVENIALTKHNTKTPKKSQKSVHIKSQTSSLTHEEASKLKDQVENIKSQTVEEVSQIELSSNTTPRESPRTVTSQPRSQPEPSTSAEDVSKKINKPKKLKNNPLKQNESQKKQNFIKICYKEEQLCISEPSETSSNESIEVPRKKKKFYCKELVDSDNSDDDFENTPTRKATLPKKSISQSSSSISYSPLVKKETEKVSQSKSKSLQPAKKKMNFIDDDDDFESPSKQILLRKCETDINKIDKHKTKRDLKLKKSISLNSSSLDLSLKNDDVNMKHRLETENDEQKSNESDAKSKGESIENLEKEIAKKKKLLEDLNRAKVCKKMHNVEELKELTSRWKLGCKSALTDLLKLINEVGNMDMETLMEKINIPGDFLPLSQ